jgi:hypothetical protein
MMAFLDYKFHYDGSELGFSKSERESIDVQALQLTIDNQAREIESLKDSLDKQVSLSSKSVNDNCQKEPKSEESIGLESKNLIELIAGVWKNRKQDKLIEFNENVGTLIKGGDKNRPNGTDFIHITEIDGKNFTGRQRFKDGKFNNVKGSYLDGVLFLQSGRYTWSFTKN